MRRFRLAQLVSACGLLVAACCLLPAACSAPAQESPSQVTIAYLGNFRGFERPCG